MINLEILKNHYYFFEQNNNLSKKIDKNNANKDIFIETINKRIKYFG